MWYNVRQRRTAIKSTANATRLHAVRLPVIRVSLNARKAAEIWIATEIINKSAMKDFGEGSPLKEADGKSKTEG